MCLGAKAVNRKKDAEEGSPETEKLLWGLQYDTEKGREENEGLAASLRSSGKSIQGTFLRGCVSLPAVKLEKAFHILAQPIFDRGSYRVQEKELQILGGNQQFWLAIKPQLAPLVGATHALVGRPDAMGFARPKGDAIQQLAAWADFHDAGDSANTRPG